MTSSSSHPNPLPLLIIHTERKKGRSRRRRRGSGSKPGLTRIAQIVGLAPVWSSLGAPSGELGEPGLERSLSIYICIWRVVKCYKINSICSQSRHNHTRGLRLQCNRSGRGITSRSWNPGFGDQRSCSLKRVLL